MHVFITGAKGTGKSTLVNAIQDSFPGTPGGFRTIRLNTFLPGRFTVHLLPISGSQTPTQENLLFVCGVPGQDTGARFDDLGCKALWCSRTCDLIIMDELGPHEAAAERFQAEVIRALDGSIPVLGVLQAAESPFLQTIARHPRVRLTELTPVNRMELLSQKQAFLKILTQRP